ncbi:hypothetical protein [Brevibacillus reuszeri]|uniref:hypothetical protein n=1 Tax=Brevibacillus reuszeri TaxID=54915 RepID=UPI0028978D18|nr:hypothetical protein [Brevibacillus reuszeri]
MNKTGWGMIILGSALLLAPVNDLATKSVNLVQAASHDVVHNRGEEEQKPNRYEVAGITDPGAFETFFAKLQAAVEKGDKHLVAKKIKYPLRVNKEGKNRFVHDEQQFLTEYDQLLTSKVKQALLQQKVADTFVNAQGVMVGDGEIWLGKFGNQFGVFAINL